MSKIKMNLDMLEEVRKQHEIAMNTTEDIINKGRGDLNSLTEEVWEGEDGDMARELLDDLLNNKMAQTWRELDTIHESIKKAQNSW
ncbi:MAG: WXG100 family type VII secretion target [Butyrivibrio sp.]|uniref:WXG100 family type VII secretion target n=1 Tax=Butyrivibrio sp. TaxID=28121 RepID=UPI0025D59EF0|nr:WXG100 family type VII secretion target [Butyrivibrio sp.]MCR5773297.1 WXG100 family type VII secretion target [Butyrivibrio sp.]